MEQNFKVLLKLTLLNQDKFFETDLFTIDSDNEIKVITLNKLLGRIYKAIAIDSRFGTEYEAHIEVLSGNKIHLLLQKLGDDSSKYIDEDIQYEILANGNLCFTRTVNGSKSTIKFIITDCKVKFIDAYFGGLSLNFNQNNAKLEYFYETLVSTDSEDANVLVVNNDGIATYGNINGKSTITSDCDGWYLNIGEEKFILNLDECKFTYVPKVIPTVKYFFIGKTFNATHNKQSY